MGKVAIKIMLQLIQARPRDAKQVARLLSAVSDFMPVYDVKKLISNKRILVLKHNKKIRGAVSFTILGFLGLFTFIWINKLAIDPQFRGQGSGTVLLALFKRYVVNFGAIGFALFSIEKAKAFYAKSSLNSVWRVFWWMN